MTPEIQLEQILQYYIAAYDHIPYIQKTRRKAHKQAILPYGSQLQTGIFIAAGYLLLKPQSTMCYIDIQKDQKELMIQKTGTYGPIFGGKYTIQILDKTLPQNNQRTETQIKTCLRHLEFSSTIQ